MTTSDDRAGAYREYVLSMLDRRYADVANLVKDQKSAGFDLLAGDGLGLLDVLDEAIEVLGAHWGYEAECARRGRRGRR